MKGRAYGHEDQGTRRMAVRPLSRAPYLEQLGVRVAHELKNPLSGVKALVQLGLRNPAETDDESTSGHPSPSDPSR